MTTRMSGKLHSQEENLSTEELVQRLILAKNRDRVLAVLSQRSKLKPGVELAPILWHAFGATTALIQEVISVYPLLAGDLELATSNRVCNALALLQCIASYRETQKYFLEANLPQYLYPLLGTQHKTRPFEYLRLTSLGVIGALVKADDPSVINYLLSTEIVPLSLRIMESGSELSKTVATFIVQKILLDEHGLDYICQTYDRFSQVAFVLGKMVHNLVKSPSERLFKHVIRCYMRLSDNDKARTAMSLCLPDPLKDNTFAPIFEKDPVTKECWLKLKHQLDSVDTSQQQQDQRMAFGGQTM